MEPEAELKPVYTDPLDFGLLEGYSDENIALFYDEDKDRVKATTPSNGVWNFRLPEPEDVGPHLGLASGKAPSNLYQDLLKHVMVGSNKMDYLHDLSQPSWEHKNSAHAAERCIMQWAEARRALRLSRPPASNGQQSFLEYWSANDSLPVHTAAAIKVSYVLPVDAVRIELVGSSVKPLFFYLERDELALRVYERNVIEAMFAPTTVSSEAVIICARKREVTTVDLILEVVQQVGVPLEQVTDLLAVLRPLLERALKAQVSDNTWVVNRQIQHQAYQA